LLFIMKRGTGMCRLANPHMPVFLSVLSNIFDTKGPETESSVCSYDVQFNLITLFESIP
jgi:hypothetical protein